MTVRARKSADRKYVVCGSCGRSLCRRKRSGLPGATGHRLAWGDGWHVVEGHIEMSDAALNRLLLGDSPGRRLWLNEARLDLTRAVQRYAPAVCPWCGDMNEIDPKPLDVDGVASY